MKQKFPLPRIWTNWAKYFPNEGYFFPDGDFSMLFDFILSGIVNDIHKAPQLDHAILNFRRQKFIFN